MISALFYSVADPDLHDLVGPGSATPLGEIGLDLDLTYFCELFEII
jgi:hypothetical protein